MDTTSIYIYGASGHGLVCADIARAVGYERVIFIDDSLKNGAVAFDESLEKGDIFIAIGNAEARSRLSAKMLKAGFNLVSLIHPSAVISSSASVGRGVCVMPRAVINAEAKVGQGAIINTGAIVEHECVIGEFAHICPGVALAGAVSVGEFAWVGIGSCAIQGIKIGANALIGAGSVIVRDIAANAKAYGNPAKIKSLQNS